MKALTLFKRIVYISVTTWTYLLLWYFFSCQSFFLSRWQVLLIFGGMDPTKGSSNDACGPNPPQYNPDFPPYNSEPPPYNPNFPQYNPNPPHYNPNPPPYNPHGFNGNGSNAAVSYEVGSNMRVRLLPLTAVFFFPVFYFSLMLHIQLKLTLLLNLPKTIFRTNWWWNFF